MNMILTQIYVDRILSEYRSNLLELNKSQILTIQGILNGYIYCAALNDDRVWRSPDRKLHFKTSDIAQFFRTDRTVIAPVTWLSDYLREHWKGLAFFSRDTVKDMRLLLSTKFKLFTLEERSKAWKDDPLNRHRQPNPCGEFNMLRALLLARACEEHLLSYGMELEALQLDIETAGNCNYVFNRIEELSFPKHKAYLLAKIGKVCGLWTDSEQPHPDLEAIIELEGLRMQAEKQFDDTDPGDGTEEEILENEMLAVTEIEVVTAGGISTVVERVVDAIPLGILVRRSMSVPFVPRPLIDSEGGVRPPAWTRVPRWQSVRWWQRAMDLVGNWLYDFAPEWAIEHLVPF